MKISKETIQFLQEIEVNNNRPWFEENKPRYKELHTEFKAFAEVINQGLERTDTIEKVKVFRIYRDVRFSKNKTPYKNNFSCSFARATSARRGGYYVHVQPGATFVGGGFWNPEPKDLRRIRDEFDMTTEYMDKIVADPNFIKHFGELRGNEVKTSPKGFSKDNPAIHYIKKKQFVVIKEFSNAEMQKANFSDKVVETLEAMRPFFDYFSDVLTTNMNGESLIDG